MRAALALPRLKAVLSASRMELMVWLAALAIYILLVGLMTAALFAGPIPPEAAEEARAFRADYLAPMRVFTSGVVAPLLETWLIVRGVDALHARQWRGAPVVLATALVAGVMHYFARGAFSALYNAAFFALMARIYLSNAYVGDAKSENRVAAIFVLVLMHMINNAVALGMIAVYARTP